TSIGWNVSKTIRNWRTDDMRSEVRSLNAKCSQKDAEIQRLETQLTPFRTIALERYTGTDAEALQKLGDRISQMQISNMESSITIERLKQQLQETKARTAPNSVVFVSKTVERQKDASLRVRLHFRHTKDEPLGR